jgi:hypothetical protein
MPRYFLHLRYGPGPDKLAVDPEGEELAGVAEARTRALQAAQDLIARTRSYAVRDWFVCSFEITDEQGQPVMTVPFSATVQDEGDQV